MKMVRQKCDPKVVKEFDDSSLSADFAKLANPAQRALNKAGIGSVRELARRTADEIEGLHGMKRQGLKFRPASHDR
jgi:hypothetical protein